MSSKITHNSIASHHHHGALAFHSPPIEFDGVMFKPSDSIPSARFWAPKPISQSGLPATEKMCSNMFKYGTFMHLCLHIAEGSINAIQDSWWFMEGTTFLELKCSCLHERSHANRWIGLWQTSCKWFVGVFDIFWNPMGSDLNQIVKMIKSQGLPLSHVPYNP